MKKKNVVPGTIAAIKPWHEIANSPHGHVEYKSCTGDHRKFDRSGCTFWEADSIRLSAVRIVIVGYADEEEYSWNRVKIRREDGLFFWGDLTEVHVDRAVLKTIEKVPRWVPATVCNVVNGAVVRYNPKGGSMPHFASRIKGVVNDSSRLLSDSVLVDFCNNVTKRCLFDYLEVRA